jgi:hypothetical protein
MLVSLLVLLAATTTVAVVGSEQCSLTQKHVVVNNMLQTQNCTNMNMTSVQEELSWLLNRECTSSTCCTPLSSNALECKIHLVVQIICDCATRNIVRCLRRAGRINEKLQDDITYNLGEGQWSVTGSCLTVL